MSGTVLLFKYKTKGRHFTVGMYVRLHAGTTRRQTHVNLIAVSVKSVYPIRLVAKECAIYHVGGQQGWMRARAACYVDGAPPSSVVVIFNEFLAFPLKS